MNPESIARDVTAKHNECNGRTGYEETNARDQFVFEMETRNKADTDFPCLFVFMCKSFRNREYFT